MVEEVQFVADQLSLSTISPSELLFSNELTLPDDFLPYDDGDFDITFGDYISLQIRRLFQLHLQSYQYE